MVLYNYKKSNKISTEKKIQKNLREEETTAE